MSDLIDRQAAINAIQKLNIPEDMCVFEIISHIEVAIATLPPAENKGEWKFYDEEFYQQGRFASANHRIRECSICHHKIADFNGNMNYCPNCGAKMKGGEERATQ